MKIFGIYYRIVARNKIFFLISTGGFSISLAIVILLLAFIRSEKQYDRSIPDLDQIYRVIHTKNAAFVPEQARERIESDFPQVLAATNVIISEEPVLWKNQNFNVRVVNTDDSFFKVFSTSFTGGIREDIFADPYRAVLTDSCARKVFGDENPVGQILNVSHRVDVQVAAIIRDLPVKSSLKGEMFCSTDLKIRYSRSSNDRQDVYLYKMLLKLSPDSRPGELQKKISETIDRYDMDWLEGEYSLQPFKEVYFDTSIPHDDLAHANVKLIRLLSWLALVILFLAVFNYINLTIAQSTGRLHELGVRQVFGADRFHLVAQFLREAFYQVLLALIFSLVLTILFKPLLSGILGKDIRVSQLLHEPGTLLLITAGIGGITLLSGFYPALAILKLQPRLMLLKQVVSIRESFDIRRFLTIIQFTAMVTLIICLVTLVKQVHYVLSKDLGYNTELLVRIPVHWRIKPYVPVLLDEISKLAGVKSACATHGTPGAIYNYSSSDGVEASEIASDYRFIQTFQLDLLYGRNMREGEEAGVCLINKKMLEDLGGWDSIVNRKIFGSQVIGVIGDFHFKDLYEPIGNLQVRNENDVSHLNVRFFPGNVSGCLADIREIFEKNAPGFAFSYEFYDDWLGSHYLQEEKRARAIRLLSIIAVILSCMGLFGMAEFSTRNRTREIGIRKVNGATTGNILLLLNVDFLKYVVLGILLGIPAGWYFMHRWLAGFAYRTGLDWWIFALAALASVTVAALTISWQTWRAARSNPVESLRYE
jgi:putative ABC transport system permease protein